MKELDLLDKSSCLCERAQFFWPKVEKLYYSAGFEQICIYCASEMLKIVMVFIQNVLLVLKTTS